MLLVKGVRESALEKYQDISDDNIPIMMKKRIIIVQNKCDHIHNHQNPEQIILTYSNLEKGI